MIINYDKNPRLTTDQKIQSLVANLQLALDELTSRCAEIEKRIEEIQKALEQSS